MDDEALTNHTLMLGLAQQLPGAMDYADCPECTPACYETPLYAIIMELNDFHHWTREQIADWLETLDIDIEFGDRHEPTVVQDDSRITFVWPEP